MANFLFTNYRNLVFTAPPNLSTLTIRAMFVDHADDTPVIGDSFISDILSVARVPALASCPALASKTIGVVAAGVFDAADTVFPALSGDQSESLILLEDSGVEATSDLLTRWDTATGLPLTPNGADVTVVWAAGGIVTF